MQNITGKEMCVGGCSRRTSKLSKTARKKKQNYAETPEGLEKVREKGNRTDRLDCKGEAGSECFEDELDLDKKSGEAVVKMTQ